MVGDAILVEFIYAGLLCIKLLVRPCNGFCMGGLKSLLLYPTPCSPIRVTSVER